MELVINHINNLFNTINPQPWDAIEKIPQSGGDRVYFRILQGAQSWMATYSLNIRESETFIYFADHFYEKGLPVPKVLAISADKTIYLQQDLGRVSLLDVLEKEGKTDHVFSLFKKSLTALARLQVHGGIAKYLKSNIYNITSQLK